MDFKRKGIQMNSPGSLFIGLVIVSIAIGVMYEAVHGWLVLGSGIILLVIIDEILVRWDKRRKVK